MRVAQLIAELRKMPQDAEVNVLGDVGLDDCVEVVWLARSGEVGIGREGESVYGQDDMPADAKVVNGYWRVEKVA